MLTASARRQVIAVCPGAIRATVPMSAPSSPAWIWPQTGLSILSGVGLKVTRAAVLEMAAKEGIELEERAFSVDEAKRAREAFYTSASGFVMPAVSIDGTRIGDGKPGPVATKLRALYLDQARREAI